LLRSRNSIHKYHDVIIHVRELSSKINRSEFSNFISGKCMKLVTKTYNTFENIFFWFFFEMACRQKMHLTCAGKQGLILNHPIEKAYAFIRSIKFHITHLYYLDNLWKIELFFRFLKFYSSPEVKVSKSVIYFSKATLTFPMHFQSSFWNAHIGSV
jgi:hypothetical protein